MRATYNRLRPLEKLQVGKRGWTLDVLQVVQSLGKMDFTLADVYERANDLAKLHPNNATPTSATRFANNSKSSATSASSISSPPAPTACTEPR